MFLIILAYAILAATFTLAKTVLFYAKPFFTIGFRMTFAGLFLITFQYFFDRKNAFPKKADAKLFFKVSLFHIYFAFVLEFWALQSMASSKVSIIYAITPFIAAALSYFLLKEKLGFRKFWGMILGFSSLFPILILQLNGAEGVEFFRISPREVILLFAVFSAAYAWFDVKKLMDRGYSLLTINGFAMFTGGLFAFITSAIFEGIHTSPVFDFWHFVGWLSLLILFSNVVFYNLYGYLLRHYSITFLTFAGCLTPIFAAFYGYMFLGEAITYNYFISLGMVMAALYIFYGKQKISFKFKK
ncbi:TPA: EamA family transporter [Candidatus Dependentiae bacterium]|nr:MAG: hypothetical protein UR14_C0007G0045 [candidate division TM6 bacterium GW2011_GWE2_31_21]KKP53594.1 MAG: hypothetical protein UR43_C0004G0135 [candidate division TM6 bacterium GW2011_GWF2_33_332]HBS48166.1 EamA family transporter [Candidatus Dependentiae bacterium]HBZ73590.1 EamA family transporter [Candidatus Dependentiae bacterium]